MLRMSGGRNLSEEKGASGLEEITVPGGIKRCAAVVKGGRRFSFSAVVVVGDRRGSVGIGRGKAREVPLAVEKASKDARRKLATVKLNGSTVTHEVMGRCGASRVFMRPARPGTGVIAGSSVRAVLELAGVRDVLTKAYGSTNPINLVKAAFDGLRRLRDKRQVADLRGVEVK
jgi:small subunit ribosomal protein S5